MDGDELMEGDIPLEGEPDLFLGEDEDDLGAAPLSEEDELTGFGMHLVDDETGEPPL